MSDDGTAATEALFGAALDKEIAGHKHRQGRRAHAPADHSTTAPDADGRVPHERTLHLTRASEITVRPVRWLWQERMPLGTLALVAGREGIGKSICVYTLAADITRGRLDGVYAGAPHAVIVAATEDSWEHTIVPRLMAAGADLHRVYRVDVTTADLLETALSLPRDLPGLERAVAEVDAALIILDPLLSRLDSALDTHKDAEVRLALEPLVTLADRTGATVAGLIHVNKSASQDALTTLMGSRAFAAVARSVLFIMADPDDEDTRLLGQAKNNLGRMDLPTLSFQIIGAKVAETAEGPVWTGKLTWTGETTRTIRDALQTAAETSGDKTATSEAGGWLTDYLTSQDGMVDSADVKREGAKAGHSKNALYRARERLHIRSEQSGFPRRAFWSLSASVVPSPGETLSNGTNGTTGTTEPHSSHSSHSSQCSQTPRASGTTAPTTQEAADGDSRFRL